MFSKSTSAETFARRQIEEHRRRNTSKMPAWLKKHRDAYSDCLAGAAKNAFEETGVWFLARGASRDKDEQETEAVWGDLLFFDKLENLPGYSKEHHKQAIEFWQSWQNLETGRLYNPLYQDPQHPENKRDTPGNRDDYSEEQINSKYIPSILAHLGAELPRPWKHDHADSNVDTFDKLWGHIARWESSPAGVIPVDAAREVEKGNLDKTPQVEAGISALIRGYNPETGMWRPEPLENFPWAEYQPSSGFKIISRLCGYIGVENFPQSILNTSIDNLLIHINELYGHPAMARNYSEMMAHCMVFTDYRHEELLDAMEQCLDGFGDKKLWEATETSTYCIFGTGLIGAFMNWEDMPMEQAFSQWIRFEHGCKMAYRFVACPYGNWVNVIPKEPEALWEHRDYDVNKYGIKASNQAHWSKKITDMMPQQDIALELSADEKTGEGSFTFTLTPEQLVMRDSLHLRATWNGAYDISLNGELVKKVRYNLPEVPAGWHIPAPAAKTLRCGKNTVNAKLISPGKDQQPGAPLSKKTPFIRIGLIDWS